MLVGFPQPNSIIYTEKPGEWMSDHSVLDIVIDVTKALNIYELFNMDPNVSKNR